MKSRTLTSAAIARKLAYKAKTTGLQYTFLISAEKADGSDKTSMGQLIVALNYADAWCEVGKWAQAFMNSADGRMVTGIDLRKFHGAKNPLTESREEFLSHGRKALGK
jgi:hypothetical protein